MLKQWGRVWAIGFVLWTVLAFLSAAGAHVYTASMGGPESWAQLLAWNITISFVWSLLTPPIYALAKRFTFDRSNWKLVHFSALRSSSGSSLGSPGLRNLTYPFWRTRFPAPSWTSSATGTFC
jgi:hypothetical protein